MDLGNIFIILTFLFKIAVADEKTDVPTSATPSACNDALRKKFEEWKAKFEITYPSDEEENTRREIFCSNSKKVQNHNGSRNSSYTRSENKHSDKTTEERNNNMLGAKKTKSSKVGNALKTTATPSAKTRRTKRSRTTRTRKTKKPVENKISTTPTTVKFTTANKPSTLVPTTNKPTTLVQTTNQPTTLLSTTNKPTTQVPTTNQPTTPKAQPTTPKTQPQSETPKKTTLKWTTKSPPTTRAAKSTTKGELQTTARPVTTAPPTTTALPVTTAPPVPTNKGVSKPEMIQYTVNSGPVPNYVNYTDDCTIPKDQYGCGACWAFSAVGVAEYWRNKARLKSNLSEQNILDCNPYGDDCDGGWPTNAFSFMINPGNSDGSLYSYKQKKSECMQNDFPPIVTIPKVCEVDLKGNETLLKELVAKHGPISVVIYVLNVMYSYRSGIFYEKNCPSDIYNHAIVVVGYGSLTNGSDPQDYWIIKNSWGTTWGMQGYGLMARNKNNHCAIASYAMYPC